MDDHLLQDREVLVDIENCRSLSGEVGSFDAISDGKLEITVNGENGVNLVSSISEGAEVSPENVKVLINKEVEGGKDLGEYNKMRNERRKTTSAKKPPKPPRPPRGLSLDAADQKLIKEIAELAMMKRARIERMKALKKMKAAKASSSSGSFFAMLFTLLFCLVIVFQGMSCRRSSPLKFHRSPESTGSVESLIMVQYHKSPSTKDTSYTGSESPNQVEQVTGLDRKSMVKRATG